MGTFSGRVKNRICYEWSRFNLMSKLLCRPARLPGTQEAIQFLENLWPDQGESCWTDCGLESEDRSIPLSVIIPAYNVENVIVPCLESVLCQKVSFEYEIIVINDGSTDGTARALEAYGSNSRIRILHQPNGGLSAARNSGIRCSKGEYLCFVDSDDELAEDALETLMATAKTEQAKLVLGSYQKCLRDGTVQYSKRYSSGKAEPHSLPGFAHGRIVHSSVFRHLRFPVGYWYEDSVMAQIVYPLCCDTTYTVSQVCYRYFTNERGISAQTMGSPKSLDSLWLTMRLLQERALFGLEPDQDAFEHFLSMVNLTYQRTKYLGAEAAQCVFVVQKMLLERYYQNHQTVSDGKNRKLHRSLQENRFRRYVLVCELAGD